MHPTLIQREKHLMRIDRIKKHAITMGNAIGIGKQALHRTTSAERRHRDRGEFVFAPKDVADLGREHVD